MLQFERPDRAGGTPKQTLSRLVRYAMDAVFGYSLKPLRLLTAVGATICLAAFVLGLLVHFQTAGGLGIGITWVHDHFMRRIWSGWISVDCDRCAG